MGKATARVNADGCMAGPTPGWHRRIVVLALPIVLANLSVPLLSAVDTAVAGHLPDQASLGGVALGGLFFNAMIWGLGFLRMATTGLVAQALGAGNAEEMRLVQLRALFLAILLGLAILMLRHPLIDGALDLLGGSAAVTEAARAYCDTRIWSAPAALANSVVLGYLLGTQRAKLGFGLQLLLNFFNMVLAIGLVYGLGLGVAGIGAATAMADGLGLVIGLGVLWRLRPHGLPPFEPSVLWARAPLVRLFGINRDIFLRTACLIGVTSLFARLGAGLGDTVLAGNAVLLNFQTFTSFGLDGFAYAAEALVGVAVGARDRSSLRAASRISMFWAVLSAAGFSLAYLAAGPMVIDGLTNQAVVRAIARDYLPWAIVLPVVSVWGFQFDGIFIGATRARELRNGMVVSLAAFLAAAFALMPIAGNHGLWGAYALFMAVRGICLAWFYPRIGAEWGDRPPQPAFVE
ncbi:MATE family efflux transporter [Aliidongia dinghuensis]|uniref:MATE family efflux transporter n=1 Tax=Aliidongia dinghuensis TaxID=1867774 RepID=A0A8J2YYL7_9PROT|nr:MATE family efflux transporter [Aliidongia dinghuensis]GGF39181.1 MATE family efflux transporter [Aliidongia dinghuensis]